MKKQKSAKRSFISSVLVLCLCFTMFVGTTYAWYNDSVTSGRNTIVSGSLEMVLDKYTGDAGTAFADSWQSIDENVKVFNETDGALTFEPGAVQVAYVRVKNAGDLAFKYSLAAKVYEEKAGTNQAGDSFLLSDYLKFGTATVTAPFATREDAIGAVSANATKLQDAALSTDGAYLKKTDAPVIVALVIYMPSDVGNVANPKPDKKPEISFGLNALATQYTIERDSFSENYDAAAPIPTAMGSATVPASGDTVVTAGNNTATVPAGSENADPNDKLTLTVAPGTQSSALQITDGNGTTTYEVTLTNQDGEKVTNNAGIKVVLDIGVVDLQHFYHNATELTAVASAAEVDALNEYYYDVTTGKLTFITDSFSPFTAEYLFDGGLGTEAYPYLIADRAQLEAISDLFETKAAYYKMTDSNMVIDATNMPFILLNGCFDGNGLTVNNLTRALFYETAYDGNTTVIKNLTINAHIARNSYFESAVALYPDNDITFDNVDVHGYIEGTAAATYVALGPGASTAINYKFINCDSDATIVATGESAAGFIVHPYCGAGSSITLEGSRYTGSMSAKGNCYYFRVNSSGAITITTDETDGASLYTNPAGSYASNADLYTAGGVKYKAGTKLTTGTITAPEGIDLVSIPKAAGASYAVATLNIGPNDTNEKGNYMGVYINETCDESNDNFVTKTIKNFNVTVNGDSTTATGISADGTTFNVVSSYYGTTYGAAFVKIIQYDANGIIVSINTLSL